MLQQTTLELIQAAQTGNAAQARKVLTSPHPPRINENSDRFGAQGGQTPLMTACLMGHTDVVRCLPHVLALTLEIYKSPSSFCDVHRSKFCSNTALILQLEKKTATHAYTAPVFRADHK